MAYVRSFFAFWHYVEYNSLFHLNIIYQTITRSSQKLRNIPYRNPDYENFLHRSTEVINFSFFSVGFFSRKFSRTSCSVRLVSLVRYFLWFSFSFVYCCVFSFRLQRTDQSRAPAVYPKEIQHQNCWTHYLWVCAVCVCYSHFMFSPRIETSCMTT